MANTDKFEMIAGMYDTPDRIHIAKVSADAIRKHVVDAGDKHAIDFGCGTGLVGMHLLDAFGSMLFLDTSPNMIRQVRAKLAEANVRHADTLVFDFEREGSSGLRADYIFMAQVLLHIPDAELVLSRLYDALNDGGHAIIVDFDKNDQVESEFVHNGFRQEELATTMERIGYRDIRSETFYEGTNLFMGKAASMFVMDARK